MLMRCNSVTHIQTTFSRKGENIRIFSYISHIKMETYGNFASYQVINSWIYFFYSTLEKT